MKTLLPLVLLLGCSEHGRTPDPFGVPITGGTLLVSNDGARAIVSDPDRDRIVTVDLASGRTMEEVALSPGDEPGRLVEDAAGRVHVALRRGKSVVTIDSAGKLLDRRLACGEPRGIAYQASNDSLHIACTGGELVTMAAAGGPATRELRLDRDLRDVVVAANDQLVITRFKTAEVITLDATGVVINRQTPPSVQRFDNGFGGVPTDGMGTGVIDAKASTAWRTIAMPDGRIVMSHQRRVKETLDGEQEGGYGGDCGGGPVEDAVSVMAPGGISAPQAVAAIGRGALPVDIATSRTGDKIAVVVAGNRTVTVVPSAALGAPDQDTCEPPPPPPPCPDQPDDIGAPSGGGGNGECCEDKDFNGRCDDDDDDQGEDRLGAPTSVAFAPNGDLVIFYPESPALIVRTGAGIVARRIELTGGARNDPGRNVFHAQTRIGLACASCHPEGREDGLVWNFAQFGLRRTQMLAGNILERAPYHWTGDMTNLNVLMDDVFAHRMSGGVLSENEKAAIGPWLGRIPAPASRTVDQNRAAAGKAIFDSPEVGCAGCHNGVILTNNQLTNVGTGGKFKVPSLIGIGARAPFMHDGCANTLMDRFVTCGGGTAHGNTSTLSPQQLGDLVEYLESL